MTRTHRLSDIVCHVKLQNAAQVFECVYDALLPTLRQTFGDNGNTDAAAADAAQNHRERPFLRDLAKQCKDEWKGYEHSTKQWIVTEAAGWLQLTENLQDKWKYLCMGLVFDPSLVIKATL